MCIASLFTASICWFGSQPIVEDRTSLVYSIALVESSALAAPGSLKWGTACSSASGGAQVLHGRVHTRVITSPVVKKRNQK